MFLLPSAQAISGCSSPQRGCEGSTVVFFLPDTSRRLPRNRFFKRYAQVNSMGIQERLKWGTRKFNANGWNRDVSSPSASNGNCA
jgi:hypothetical protein